MRSSPQRSTTADRLVEHLLDDATSPLAAELAAWLGDSPRFRTFVDAHEDKIRKKLRAASDEESRRDVRAELHVAHSLLADRRIGLAFERYGSRQAAPDFAVTFRDHAAFNLEVTRIRRPAGDAAIAGALVAKLRQLLPGAANVVLFAVERPGTTVEQLRAAVRRLRQRADARDEVFLRAHGSTGPRAFYDRFLRLGGVIAWWDAGTGTADVSVWTNPSARTAVPPQALRATIKALAAAGTMTVDPNDPGTNGRPRA